MSALAAGISVTRGGHKIASFTLSCSEAKTPAVTKRWVGVTKHTFTADVFIDYGCAELGLAAVTSRLASPLIPTGAPRRCVLLKGAQE